MMGTIAEKVPCELKDHRQQGLMLKQTHTLTNVSAREMTKCRSKATRNRAVLVMPTSVINSQLVLIVRLICHDDKVCEKIVFCKTSLSSGSTVYGLE